MNFRKLVNKILSLGCVQTPIPPTYTPGDVVPLALDANGHLIVNTSSSETFSPDNVDTVAPVATNTQLNVNAVCYGFRDATGFFERFHMGGETADNIAPQTKGQLQVNAANYGYNDTTAGFDRMRSLGNNADAVANVTLGYSGSMACMYGYNNTNWDRVRAGSTNSDGKAGQPTGYLSTQAFLYIWNGASWDRRYSFGTNADALATTATGAAASSSFLLGWNNATWDRIRTSSAANLGATSSAGAIITTKPGNWSQRAIEPENTQATITMAAAPGKRHVCTAITASITCVTTPTPSRVYVTLYLGATAVWFNFMCNSATPPGSTINVNISGLNLVGNINEAVTLEFSAAGGAGTYEAICLIGYDAP